MNHQHKADQINQREALDSMSIKELREEWDGHTCNGVDCKLCEEYENRVENFWTDKKELSVNYL